MNMPNWEAGREDAVRVRLLAVTEADPEALMMPVAPVLFVLAAQ
jgi:hypothetical protein